MTAHPPKPSGFVPSIPPELDAIVYRLLEKKPDDRFQSAGQLIAALEGKPERAATPVPKSISSTAAHSASAPADAPTRIDVDASGPVPDTSNIPEAARTLRDPAPDSTTDATKMANDAGSHDSRKTVAMTAPAHPDEDAAADTDSNSDANSDANSKANSDANSDANSETSAGLPVPLIAVAVLLLAALGVWFGLLR